MGVRQGGSQATFLPFLALIRPYNFILKSLLFLIPFFFDFGSILGAKMTPESKKILLKSTSKVHSNFETFAIGFLWISPSIFDPLWKQKSS